MPSGRKGIINQSYAPEIITLLEAVHHPKEVAVVHLRVHQKGENLESKGNNSQSGSQTGSLN